MSGWRLACECGRRPFSLRQRPARALWSLQEGPRVRVPERRVAAAGPDPWTDKTTSPPSRRPSRRHQRHRPTGPPARRARSNRRPQRRNEQRPPLEGRTGPGPTRAPTLPAFRWARQAHEKAGFAGSPAGGELKFRGSSWARLQNLGRARVGAGEQPDVLHGPDMVHSRGRSRDSHRRARRAPVAQFVRGRSAFRIKGLV